MAAQEAHVKETSTWVQLANSDSEFKLIESNTTNTSTLGNHCIYTIDELNGRIADLTESIEKFGNEERDVFVDNELDTENCSVVDSQLLFGNEKERYDVKQFSGVFSVHSVLSNNKKTKKALQKKTKENNGNDADRMVGMKPMLVELHVFPGFHEKHATPLPVSYDTLFIFEIVMKAQTELKNKLAYQMALKEFLMSNQSHSILQDSFWWFFCSKYQPTSEDQGRLFDRISKDYTHLLVAWTGLKYQDKILKNYANLVSQAIYTIFCHVFPTSYRQFNGDFRDEIVALMTLWFMGAKPAPRSWANWNFHVLEPSGLRKGEKLKDDVIRARSLEMDLKKLEDNKLPHETSSTEQAICGQPNDKKEHDIQEDKIRISESKDNIIKHICSVVRMNEKKQSCAAGEGALFTRVVFDVYGRSPLVEHFLQTRNLLKNAGTSVLVQRTEILSLPSLCATTYEDIVTSTKRSSKEAREKYQRSTENINQEKQRCLQKQRVDDLKFKRCSRRLLSNPRQVKKISELLRSPDGKEEPDDRDIRTGKLRSLLSRALEQNDE